MKKQFDVFGIGQCCQDFLTIVPHFPEPDAKVECRDMTIQGGGPVATALVALYRWGLSTSFCGVVGDDSFGHTIIAELKEEGVDTTPMLVRKGHSSQVAFIAAEPGAGRRTIFWQRPSGDPPQNHELDTSLLENCSMVHLDGLFQECCLRAAQRAKELSIPVVADIGSYREGVERLIPFVDYCITSEGFGNWLGQGDKEKACRMMVKRGAKLGCVTLGDNGYIAYTRNEVIHGKAYPVEALDTTGCGDIFHAGFMYGVLNQWSVGKSLDFGAWAASRCALALGGRVGIPLLQQIKEWEETCAT